MRPDTVTENLIHHAAGYQVHVSRTLRQHQTRGTLIMVNGAMSTTASYSWAVTYLQDYDLILFDYPCNGQSKTHNEGCEYPDRECEAAILLSICYAYKPDFLCSMSWGGASALIALAQNPPSVKKAIIGAFSFGVTDEMRLLIHEMDALLSSGEMHKFSQLVNRTLGQHLPPRLQKINEIYLANLSADEIAYLKRHFHQTLAIEKRDYLNMLAEIQSNVLFVNGSKDAFTSAASIEEARAVIRNGSAVMVDAGHFMSMEGKKIANELITLIGKYLQIEQHFSCK